MRIAVISHSNIALRQQRFCEELSKDAQVLCIAPREWNGAQTVDMIMHNYELRGIGVSSNDMYKFTWQYPIKQRLQSFSPDFIYCMNEWNSNAARQLLKVAREIDSRFVLFTWENLKKPTEEDLEFLRQCDGIVCGNLAAFDLCNVEIPKCILAQVGIDTDFFKILDREKKNDFVYVGRDEEIKGVGMIKEAWPKTHFVHDIAYEFLPDEYNEAKLFVGFPIDTDKWLQQVCYSYVEALSCGVPVICSDAGNLPLWLSDCISVFQVQQKDVCALRETMQSLLKLYDKDPDHYNKLCKFAQSFAKDRYSNEFIAKVLLKFLEAIGE